MSLLLLLALLLFGAGASAQEQELTVSLAGLTADGWPQAQAVVTVLDGDGQVVAGLAETDFAASLNDAAVPIVELSQGVDSSLPISVLLALDVSGSMVEGGALEQAKLSARQFLDGLGADDSVAVLTFNEEVQLVQPFTQDKDAAAAVIAGLGARGATALYQATEQSVRLAAESESQRQAVVLLSDGLDHGSAVSRADALAAADTLGVPLFTIGLGADIDRAYLRDLAESTGGQFAETPTPAGLTQLYQNAAELLRGQYILTLDSSRLGLDASEPALLRVDVTFGELAGGEERTVCPQDLCVTLSDVASGERLEAERTVSAQVISADPIASVTFLVDGEPALVLTEPPYEFTFDPAAYAGGEHALSAAVVTTAGGRLEREVVVLAGAAGGGISPVYFVAGAGLIAAIGAALVLLIVRRRGRRQEEEAPRSEGQPEPPARLIVPGARPRLRAEEAAEAVPVEPPVPELLGSLQMTGRGLASQAFPVGEAPVSIGVGHRCRIRLEPEGDEIAPQHARVWVRDGQLMVHEIRRLTAFGATGGRWQMLASGETFTIGPYTFVFELGGAEAVEVGARSEVPNILRDAPDAVEEPSPSEATGAAALSEGTENGSAQQPEEARARQTLEVESANGSQFTDPPSLA